MQSLMDVLYFNIQDMGGKELEVGDFFSTTFCGYDTGPFVILNLQPNAIVYSDLSSGITVQQDMKSFKAILENVYKIA